MGGFLSHLSRRLRQIFAWPQCVPFKHVFNLPWPQPMHYVVSTSELARYGQVFIIGDVHGCLDELKLLLKTANAESNNTLKIFAGDMISKGPKSIETINYIRGLQHLAVRGNHEEAVLREYKIWRNSFKVELRDKHRWITDLSQDEIDYLKNLPFSISIPDLNAIIVHAGLLPDVPLCQQDPRFIVTMRNIVTWPDGIQTPNANNDGRAWVDLWKGPQHVYFGHDAKRKLQLAEYATGLDTGCVYGGQLTGVFVKGPREGEIVSVDALDIYKVPGEWEFREKDDNASRICERLSMSIDRSVHELDDSKVKAKVEE